VLLNVLREIDPDAARAEPKEGETVAVPAIPQADVVLYCTSWCPDCRRARNWLKTNNLNYVEVDIDTNPVASDQVKKWNEGKRITPTFDIGGVIITNFNEQKITDALKNRLKK
jgi:thioredoxin reductase (NADPH)